MSRLQLPRAWSATLLSREGYPQCKQMVRLFLGATLTKGGRAKTIGDRQKAGKSPIKGNRGVRLGKVKSIERGKG